MSATITEILAVQKTVSLVRLTIGILFGIYSSVFVAAAIAMWLGVKREDLMRPSAKDIDPNDPNAGAVV